MMARLASSIIMPSQDGFCGLAVLMIGGAGSGDGNFSDARCEDVT